MIPGIWQPTSKWRFQGERSGMTKSQVAREEREAVGVRRGRLETKPSLWGKVMLG